MLIIARLRVLALPLICVVASLVASSSLWKGFLSGLSEIFGYVNLAGV